MWLLYALLAICVITCFWRDLCPTATAAILLGFIALGALFEKLHFYHHGLFRGLGVLLFGILIGIEFLDPPGFQTFFFHLCLDTVWALIGYRALCHTKTTERVQVGVLTIIPLVCLSIDMPALEFLVFLAFYFSILFGFLIRQAMAEPTTGSLGVISGRIRGVKISRAQFWRTIAWLALIAFAIGGALFLVVPRWGADAPVPGLEQPKGGFPDVALDRTGKINLDPSLMFRVDLPEIPEGYYWRVDIQNAFDGTSWRSMGSPIQNTEHSELTSRPPYTLEFVREWRDFRIPTIVGTTAIVQREEEADAEIRFYQDTLGLWHRWGWKRGVPLMGFYFYTEYVQDEGNRQFERLKARFGIMFERIGAMNYLQDAAVSANNPHMIWPSKRRDPIAWMRLRTFALEIVKDATTNREKADRVRNYLQSHYQYSLERPPRQGAIVDDFLFRQQFGHCEVFSTTMAVLMAILDVPVHNVTGFVSTEFRDGYHNVRSAHAHSWVEVYIDGRWVIYDPTPTGAQHVEVDWLLRIDDWFSSYQPQKLYTWIYKNLLLFLAALAIISLAIALSWIVIRWTKKRLLPTQEVWHMAWHDLQKADSKKDPQNQVLSRPLEDWWSQDDPDHKELQSFIRDYIKNLYTAEKAAKSAGFAAFRENCSILQRLKRLL